MDLLESAAAAAGGGKRPADRAKVAVLRLLQSVTDLSEKIRKFKDKKDLDEFLGRVVAGRKPVVYAELEGIAKGFGAAKALVDAAEDAERKRVERAAKKAEKAAVEARSEAAEVAGVGAGKRPGGGRRPAGAGTAEDPKPPTAGGGKAPIRKGLKKAIWMKHIGKDYGCVKCPVCQLTEITQLDFDAGHILAESRKGATDIDNLIPICHSCNICMATQNMNDYCYSIYKRGIVLPAKA